MNRILSSLSVFLFLNVLGQIASAEENSKSECEFAKNGSHHVLTISFEMNTITSFRYFSITGDGDTCEIEGKKNSPTAVWHEDGKGARIDTFALGREAGSVYIQRLDGGYRVTVLSELMYSCGVKGYLVPVVTLIPGVTICEQSK